MDCPVISEAQYSIGVILGILVGGMFGILFSWRASPMPMRAADDFDTIRKRFRRNLVETAIVRSGQTAGQIPDEILLGAGYTPEEISRLGSQRTLPLNETDLLL